jgi:hypothetical protein
VEGGHNVDGTRGGFIALKVEKKNVVRELEKRASSIVIDGNAGAKLTRFGGGDGDALRETKLLLLEDVCAFLDQVEEGVESVTFTLEVDSLILQV